jgi:hypothetical protein
MREARPIEQSIRECSGAIEMDALSLLAAALAVVAGLAAFDWLAGRFGTDSRDRIGDDHRRPAGF